jgi:hypothetical protein
LGRRHSSTSGSSFLPLRNLRNLWIEFMDFRFDANQEFQVKAIEGGGGPV